MGGKPALFRSGLKGRGEHLNLGLDAKQMIRSDWLHLSRINTLHHFRCSTYSASDTYVNLRSGSASLSETSDAAGFFRRRAPDGATSISSLRDNWADPGRATRKGSMSHDRPGLHLPADRLARSGA